MPCFFPRSRVNVGPWQQPRVEDGFSFDSVVNSNRISGTGSVRTCLDFRFVVPPYIHQAWEKFICFLRYSSS